MPDKSRRLTAIGKLFRGVGRRKNENHENVSALDTGLSAQWFLGSCGREGNIKYYL